MSTETNTNAGGVGATGGGAANSTASGSTDASQTTTDQNNANEQLSALEKHQAGILSELKKEREKRREAEMKASQLEQEQLEREGKKDEVIAKLKKDKQDLMSLYNNDITKAAENIVKIQMEAVAQGMGCIDTELLHAAVDWKSLTDGDNRLDVNTVALRQAVEDVRKRKPHLFKQSGPEVRDGVPSSRGTAQGKVDFSKMSTAELKQYAVSKGIS